MHYKHNIHNKKQNSTMNSYPHTQLHLARGIDGLYPERNVALVSLHI